MLTYSFDKLGKMPLYEYLYRCIRKDIEEGRLQVGEKLPSKRALARQLGISTITVEGAYGQLTAEGYCKSLPKRGFYVTEAARVIQKEQAAAMHRILSKRQQQVMCFRLLPTRQCLIQ